MGHVLVAWKGWSGVPQGQRKSHEIPKYTGRSSIPCNFSYSSWWNGYFMDDYAPIHWARSAQNRFAKHQCDFQHLSWSPHSPDLNPIENVWNMVKRCIRQHSPLPCNLQDLKSCIANVCYSLDVNALQKLVDSMPKRIRAKDGPIKSWSRISNSLASVCI